MLSTVSTPLPVQLKANFLKEAEKIFDELMAWDDVIGEPNMREIEMKVLESRKRLGEERRTLPDHGTVVNSI